MKAKLIPVDKPLHVGTESKREEPVRIEFVNLRINHDPPHEMSLKNATFFPPWTRDRYTHLSPQHKTDNSSWYDLITRCCKRLLRFRTISHKQWIECLNCDIVIYIYVCIFELNYLNVRTMIDIDVCILRIIVRDLRYEEKSILSRGDIVWHTLIHCTLQEQDSI